MGRYYEKDIKSKYSSINLKKVVGSEGYAWIEDTTAFHRGTVPINGNRLILSLCFNDKKSINHFVNRSSYYALPT